MTVHATNERYNIESDNPGVPSVGRYQLGKFRPHNRRGGFCTPPYAAANTEERVMLILCFLIASGQVQAHMP